MAEYKWIKESQHLTMPMTVMHGLPLGTIDLFCRTLNGYNRQIFSCTSLKSLAVPIAIGRASPTFFAPDDECRAYSPDRQRLGSKTRSEQNFLDFAHSCPRRTSLIRAFEGHDQEYNGEINNNDQ